MGSLFLSDFFGEREKNGFFCFFANMVPTHKYIYVPKVFKIVKGFVF